MIFFLPGIDSMFFSMSTLSQAPLEPGSAEVLPALHDPCSPRGGAEPAEPAEPASADTVGTVDAPGLYIGTNQ